MHEVRNLTPHAVRLVGETDVVELPPEGVVPRVTLTTEERIGEVVVHGLAVPLLCTASGGEVTGLPDEVPGVLLIVARAVAQARPQRRDLVFPHLAVRDENGVIVGCRALGQLWQGSPGW